MKLGIRILIAVLAILCLLLGTAYIFIAVNGKVLLAEKLQDALKKETSIGYLGLKAPFDLEIKDLRIEGLTDVDYICVSPSLSGLIRGKILLNKIEILRPKINWERRLSADAATKENPANIEKTFAQAKAILYSPGTKDSSKTKYKQPLPIIIKHLAVKEGIIDFTDRTIPEPGLRITLKEVLFEADNLCFFPESAVTNFQLTAKIPWQEDSNEGAVYAFGWINLYEKDIQARLEIEGIDGVYLYPYYSSWVDLENLHIEEASLNFTSDIRGQNNDVVAQCRLELTDIKFRPRPPDQPKQKAEKIAAAVLGILRSLNQGKIVLNFTIRTKMDNPELNFGSMSQAVASSKTTIEDVALPPGILLEGQSNY